ncbi:hypothetical protein ROHU_034053 [Labeo rohita]|uniref:Uncharacterized protein n=1 Tax=Labeo rohita TaxID=84645 RepID=A0A498LFU3_LABRO|nr:hypothetical protein ROHU_034053 [Labeo rohita]
MCERRRLNELHPDTQPSTASPPLPGNSQTTHGCQPRYGPIGGHHKHTNGEYEQTRAEQSGSWRDVLVLTHWVQHTDTDRLQTPSQNETLQTKISNPPPSA